MFHFACRIAIVGNSLGITYPHPRMTAFSEVIDDVAAYLAVMLLIILCILVQNAGRRKDRKVRIGQ